MKVVRSWFAYILQCGDNTYYTGFATDIKEEIKRHNDGKVRKTRNRRPCLIRFMERHATKVGARRRARQMGRLPDEVIKAIITSCPFPGT